MKKALKLFASFLIFIIATSICIVLGFGALFVIAYVCSLLAKVAILGTILKVIGYSFMALVVVFLIIGGTLEAYQRVFQRRKQHDSK